MKTLTLIIPVYNESKRIQKTLDALKKGFHLRGLKLTKIIFTDDGSTDNTVKIINSQKSAIFKATNAAVKVISYPLNMGRGYAVRQAAKLVTSDYAVYTDADFSIPLTNLKACLPYINQNYGLIFGSKKKSGAVEVIKRSFFRRVIGYGHSFLVSSILGTFAWDYQGGFKVFSKEFIRNVFPSLTINHWGFDMEVVFLAKKLNYKNAEIPVIWSHVDQESKVKVFKDIRQAIIDAVKIRSNWNSGSYLDCPYCTIKPALNAKL